MYDPEDPRHQNIRRIVKAAMNWTPEKEKALQRRFEAMGLKQKPQK